jgi:GDSL-like Lipase/Acylhydrolase family
VDGLSKGVFPTLNGTRNRLVRTHTFDYVRNKQVIIRAVRGAGTGVHYLELEAIRTHKKVVITTQGVIGTNARTFATRNFGMFGPSVMTPETNYVFVQLGTNDRIANRPAQDVQVGGVQSFKSELKALLDLITPSADVILMCAGPVVNNEPPTYAFGMQDARNIIDEVAKEGSLDFIDHFGALRQLSPATVLADGLHPNEAGHEMMATNMLNAVRGPARQPTEAALFSSARA